MTKFTLPEVLLETRMTTFITEKPTKSKDETNKY